MRLTGLTSRTLRHYDAQGVVRPVGVGAGGVRLYGRQELVRLQQVLILRELGLSLSAVREVVDGTVDRAAALRDHRGRLRAERKRLDGLIDTVSATIEELEGGAPMSEEQLFEGFDPERQKAYEGELVANWGVSQGAIDESRQAVASLGPAGIAANEARRAEIEAALLALYRAQARPDDPRVLEALVGHWELTASYWGQPPTAEAYAGLGEMYVQHPDFKARYDAMAEGFPEWLSTAMAAYAQTAPH